jgi:hypothetical protein
VRRLVALLIGGLGLRALLRRRAQRPALAPSPADDLKAKLEESRALDGAREEFEAGETPLDAVPDVDTRRADAHARAREAIDELG